MTFFHPFLLGIVTTALLQTASAATGEPKREEQTSPVGLRVMTFNLRYASTNTPNSWASRRPVMKACWKKIDADIAGTQEGLYDQIRDLASDVPAYDWIGLGRDGGSRGEFMAIFYRKSRFEPREYDHFWLSDTPNVVASTNWGNTNRRMVTWARFREKATGREFYFVNTHLDHALRPAREKGARLIRDRIAALAPPGPVILVGDFNAEPGRESTYDLLTQDGFLRDTWTTAARRRHDNLNTFHNFRGPEPGTFRIDWILTRGPWHCLSNEVVLFERRGQYPSDHHPVVAQVVLQ